MKFNVDFYDELKLPKDKSVEEINKMLTQLEKDWTKRQINTPDKATKMLALIIDARATFKSPLTRAEYDRELEASKRDPANIDPYEERTQSFQKWYTDAKGYFESKQYDLAKTVIDRASQYTTPETTDIYFYGYAADIYSNMGNHQQAIEYANQAIVLSPENHYGYIVKSAALERYILSPNTDSKMKNGLIEQMVSMLIIAGDKAKANEDSYQASQAFAWLANIYYNYNLYKDKSDRIEVSEYYATESLAQGHEFENAKKVFDEISAIRETEKFEKEKLLKEEKQKLEQEKQRKQAEDERLNDAYNMANEMGNSAKSSRSLKKVSEIFASLGDYRDSKQRAEHFDYSAASAQGERLWRITITAVLCILLYLIIIVSSFINSEIIMPNRTYNEGISSFENGDYSHAASMFRQIRNYKDSDDMYLKAQYQLANEYMAAGHYGNAKTAFSYIKSYKNSAKLWTEAIYQIVSEYLDAGEYEDAIAELSQLDGQGSGITPLQESDLIGSWRGDDGSELQIFSGLTIELWFSSGQLRGVSGDYSISGGIFKFGVLTGRFTGYLYNGSITLVGSTSKYVFEKI